MNGVNGGSNARRPCAGSNRPPREGSYDPHTQTGFCSECNGINAVDTEDDTVYPHEVLVIDC